MNTFSLTHLNKIGPNGEQGQSTLIKKNVILPECFVNTYASQSSDKEPPLIYQNYTAGKRAVLVTPTNIVKNDDGNETLFTVVTEDYCLANQIFIQTVVTVDITVPTAFQNETFSFLDQNFMPTPFEFLCSLNSFNVALQGVEMATTGASNDREKRTVLWTTDTYNQIEMDVAAQFGFPWAGDGQYQNAPLTATGVLPNIFLQDYQTYEWRKAFRKIWDVNQITENKILYLPLWMLSSAFKHDTLIPPGVKLDVRLQFDTEDHGVKTVVPETLMLTYHRLLPTFVEKWKTQARLTKQLLFKRQINVTRHACNFNSENITENSQVGSAPLQNLTIEVHGIIPSKIIIWRRFNPSLELEHFKYQTGVATLLSAYYNNWLTNVAVYVNGSQIMQGDRDFFYSKEDTFTHSVPAYTYQEINKLSGDVIGYPSDNSIFQTRPYVINLSGKHGNFNPYTANQIQITFFDHLNESPNLNYGREQFELEYMVGCEYNVVYALDEKGLLEKVPINFAPNYNTQPLLAAQHVHQ